MKDPSYKKFNMLIEMRISMLVLWLAWGDLKWGTSLYFLYPNSIRGFVIFDNSQKVFFFVLYRRLFTLSRS